MSPSTAATAGLVSGSGAATGTGDRSFLLPDLGEGLTEAEVMEWHVAVGDAVTVDQIVVTVETAKATVDLPCPYAGRVAALHGSAGQTLAVGEPLLSVGEPLATIDEPLLSVGEPLAAIDETSPPDRKAQPVEPAPAEGEESAGTGSGNVLIGYGTSASAGRRRRRVPPMTTGTSARTKHAGAPTVVGSEAQAPLGSSGPDTSGPARVISPVVRRLARDNGIDPSTLTGAAPDGVVRRRDVESALEAASGIRPGQSEDLRTPLTGVRRVIAERLSTSRREIPDATTWVDVDATGLLRARDELRAAAPDDHIGLLALLARITVAGLRAFPELNARVDLERQEIVQLRGVNLGFAAQSPRGLVVPVVHGADAMTTAELASALRELTALARDGRLSPAQLTGGTFTLNNYGVFGVDGSTPIINHPEAAMLGVGRVIDRPWAHEGQLALRKVAQLSFTFDHRVCDGGTAGGFLRFVADCVERPATLLARV